MVKREAEVVPGRAKRSPVKSGSLPRRVPGKASRGLESGQDEGSTVGLELCEAETGGQRSGEHTSNSDWIAPCCFEGGKAERTKMHEMTLGNGFVEVEGADSDDPEAAG